MIETARKTEVLGQSPISYGFRFEEHLVRAGDYERKKEVLVDSLRQVFKIGEENIFVHEDISGTVERQREFNETYAATSSFVEAHAYFALKKLGHSFINERLLDTAVSSTRSAINSTPQLAYEFLRFDALDTLRKEGYNIKIVIEKGALAKVPMPATPTTADADIIQRYITDLAAHARSRNNQLISQLTELETQTKKRKQKTNIFVDLGIFHNSLVEILPTRIQKNILYASSEPQYLEIMFDRPENRIMNTIINKLTRNQKVSDEEWNEYFS